MFELSHPSARASAGRRWPRALAALLAACVAALPLAASADVFSPGDLSRPHAQLEGLKNCTSCHVAGEQLSPERCLACHTELKSRVEKGKGFHGRMSGADRACEKCHPEHQGRGFALINWGSGGRDRFDHGKAGYALAGKHAQVGCDKCHTSRRIADAELQAVLAKQPKRTSYLGMPSRCSSCHFDEHRGQLGADCERCHTEKGWKPTIGFDHAKTAYPLEAKHAQVACDKCHAREQDAKTAADAFPAPRAASFARFRPVGHAACNDCHKDPHEGRFGTNCVGCHSPAGWNQVRNLQAERGFHDKTRFPLKGAHASVACAACHGTPAKFKGIAFAQCTDCHEDAHLGQLAKFAATAPPAATSARRATAPDCARCHDVNAYKPPHFEQEDHEKTAFPLRGAHQAVACGLCHAQDASLSEKIPAQLRKSLRGKGRAERFSFARFAMRSERCEDCHTDPHRGQFAQRQPPKACADCHGVDSFHAVRFDHARDTRWPLTGKHASAPCAGCHVARDDGKGAAVVRYRPLDTGCESCHLDIHLGQFATAGAATDCSRCHTTADFKPTLFAHREPFTRFTLDGRHAQVACEKCHTAVEVAPGIKTRRFTGLPTACEGCHADPHKGAFRGLESLSAIGQGRAAAESSPTPGTATGASALSAAASSEARTRCAACHSVQGWGLATVAHDKTGFPLRGAHARAGCRDCHLAGFDVKLSQRCSSCHRDVHAGQLGQRCEGCHEDATWQSRFGADAHRRTNFPLSGRHAFIACEECHPGASARSFSRSTVDCWSCHSKDYDRTALGSVNHLTNGFSHECRDCHLPWSWSPARFEQHDRCFQITGGPHAGIRCLNCHTSLPGTAIGNCSSNTASCTRCHACGRIDRQHRDVPGYQCKDRKCYECHRFASGG